jgi:hypothetical protein
MNLITLSQLPAWLEGGFSKDLRENSLEEGPEDDCLIQKSLKLHCIFNDLRDLLEMIDTYIYMQLYEFPREFYEFARGNKGLTQSMLELESGNGPLSHLFELTKTPEYAAIKVCINNKLQEDLLTAAIIMNQMGIIRYVIEDLGYCQELQALMNAVRSGHIHIIEYIFSIFPEVKPIFKFNTNWPLVAVKNGNLAMLVYLKEQVGSRWNDRDILKTALTNHKESCAVYLLKNGCRLSSNSLELACNMDSLELVRLMVEGGQIPEIASSSVILNYAIRMDKLEIARYLYDRGNKPNQQTLFYLTDCKNPECARFAEEICMAEF